ncbi:interleukin-13 receptor subunit alpha-1-like [Genypterus blacodes]|uniref:interleukin-13 receptor subunit alpha-1-like n=1 Tax=Genypterus blacodes TaxID=154954 RepID=UPI003F77134D
MTEDKMSFTRTVLTVLKCVAMVVFVHCSPEPLPPPTDLSISWNDQFTVTLSWSWQRPSRLEDSCLVGYKVGKVEDDTTVGRGDQFYSTICTTESNCTFTVETMTEKCDASWTNSKPVTISIERPSAVVREYTCFLYNKDTMDCSWVPVNPSLDLMVLYKLCTSTKEPLQMCENPYSSGRRRGCYLNIKVISEEICMLVNETSQAVGWNSFTCTPSHNVKVPPPKFTVTAEGDKLNVNWTHPGIGENACWNYTICYRICLESNSKCVHHTDSKPESHVHKSVYYDERCHYEFQMQANMDDNCGQGQSDMSEVITYGADQHPDRLLTVVVVAIPVILSISVILSCYCFKRHSSMLFPVLPDPSVIFKEMMNVNKEAKATTGSVYVPVPEAVEPCKITLATENSVLQQNS